jgi:hypothetical protein
MGFIEDTGAAQQFRDARIAPIYEGTNGIQALTLLRRGLLRDQGAALSHLLDDIAATAPNLHASSLHASNLHASSLHTSSLGAHCATVRQAAAWLRHAAPRAAEAGASPFLAMLGTLTAGWLCARLLATPAAPPAAQAAAQMFIDQLLPRVPWHAAQLVTPGAAMVGRGAVA